ncbi:MAG: hypothetical protein F6K41_36720, partial [Symploca sp. SIO3E6]|nr:hypothetical protein [Caldora sp. SIO3E6]
WYLQGDTNLARKAKNIIDAKENLGSPVLMVKIPVFLIASSKIYFCHPFSVRNTEMTTSAYHPNYWRAELRSRLSL